MKTQRVTECLPSSLGAGAEGQGNKALGLSRSSEAEIRLQIPLISGEEGIEPQGSHGEGRVAFHAGAVLLRAEWRRGTHCFCWGGAGETGTCTSDEPSRFGGDTCSAAHVSPGRFRTFAEWRPFRAHFASSDQGSSCGNDVLEENLGST